MVLFVEFLGKLNSSKLKRIMTHFAIIKLSNRIIPVTRMGKLLIVHHGPCKDNRQLQSISTVKYDHRFKLLPKKS